jgi:hypothetical protein
MKLEIRNVTIAPGPIATWAQLKLSALAIPGKKLVITKKPHRIIQINNFLFDIFLN